MPTTETTSKIDARSSSPRAAEPLTPHAAGGLRLALVGGGTGGHIVPGLHLLAHARESGRELEDVVWFTSGRAIEDRVMGDLGRGVASSSIERIVLALEPEGGGAPSRSRLVLRTPAAVAGARHALVRHRSQVLLGLGGFTCLPAVLAARSLEIPVALLEINAHEGQATRWLARFASRVLHAWPSTMPETRRSRESKQGESREVAGGIQRLRGIHEWIGPPLPSAFVALVPSPDDEGRARAELGFDPDRPLLLVLGGSQGASGLNQFVRAHAPALVASGLQVLHQAGPNKLDEASPPFSGYRAVEYIDGVYRALTAATLVLCRGGASTLAEIAALRRPAVVVPYPHHADHHQQKNAEQLGEGARIVPEARLNLALRQDLIELCGPLRAAERERMSAALAGAVPADACARLYAALCELARSGAARRRR